MGLLKSRLFVSSPSLSDTSQNGWRGVYIYLFLHVLTYKYKCVESVNGEFPSMIPTAKNRAQKLCTGPKIYFVMWFQFVI
jgi:hypothetical protein